jgi:hypothetical protein
MLGVGSFPMHWPGNMPPALQLNRRRVLPTIGMAQATIPSRPEGLEPPCRKCSRASGRKPLEAGARPWSAGRAVHLHLSFRGNRRYDSSLISSAEGIPLSDIVNG